MTIFYFTESLGKTKKSPGGLSQLVGVSTASSGACSSSTHQKTEDSARRHIAMELLQTEKNFVDILDVIVKVRNLLLRADLWPTPQNIILNNNSAKL